jgi:hypothetical protein
MAKSRAQQILDAVVAGLVAAAPAGSVVKKGRKAPTNLDGPKVQVYWHYEKVRAIGDPRKPMMHSRNLVLEIKVTVPGDDEAFDVERQWIIAAMWNLGDLNRLVKDIEEAETIPYLEDSSEDGTITASAIRYAVEYTTLPGDLTAGTH